MREFKFIHASDLHLDSQFKGRFSEVSDSIRQQLIDSTFEAYEKIVDLCIEKNVDALLIAGDVYDGADRSLRAQSRFISGLNRLNSKSINVFICHGNHDPLDGWQSSLDFPGNCFRYRDTVETFPLLGKEDESVLVHGISYPRREVRNNLIPEFPPPVEGRFNIGLVHANVGSDTGHESYAPCELSDLINTRYDYWALGHVHTKAILRADKPMVVYPGNTQGRHINESGPRGVYLIEVDEGGSVTSDFLETDVIRWMTMTVDCSEMDRLQSLREHIAAGLNDLQLEALERPIVVRITLSGSTSLHEELSRPQDMEDLKDMINEECSNFSPFIWCEKLEIDTYPLRDRDQLKSSDDFVGELLRLTDKILDDPEELSKLSDELGIGEIFSPTSKVGKRLKFSLTEKEIYALVKDAERIYLDELLIGDHES